MSALGRKLINQLKSKKFREYLMTTHFWAPAATFSIPLAAINDFRNDPKYISGKMTLALFLYSAVFMRFSFRVKPRNMLLFTCHVCNGQSVQGIRFVRYNYLGGNEEKPKELEAVAGEAKVLPKASK